MSDSYKDANKNTETSSREQPPGNPFLHCSTSSDISHIKRLATPLSLISNRISNLS
jgi:hypothetical protein